MKFIHLTLPTGHVYEIPVEPIAKNRAQAMLKAHPDEFADIDAAMEDTNGLFADDNWNIKDWAANNMNWSEIVRFAKLVRYTPPTDRQWHEGEWSYTDHQALLGELDGSTLMAQPVELVMHTMASAQQLCNVTVLHGDEKQPYGAFVMIIGHAPVLQQYMTALQFVTDRITPQAAPADTPTH